MRPIQLFIEVIILFISLTLIMIFRYIHMMFSDMDFINDEHF